MTAKPRCSAVTKWRLPCSSEAFDAKSKLLVKMRTFVRLSHKFCSGKTPMMQDPIARSILEGLGWRDAFAAIAVGDEGKLLPTSVPVERIAAGVIAALGTAICDVWEVRSGRRQSGSVTTRAAGLAVAASSFLRVSSEEDTTEL